MEVLSNTDAQAHERFNGGEAVGHVDFDTFYARTRDEIYRTVLLSTRHPERAEDALHEAYARALADWSRLAAHPNPAAWVARVALNQATSWWRVWHREATDPPDGPAPADEAPMDGAIVRILWRLPRRQREVVALRVLLDLSVDDTAQALGIAPGTVKAHLNRALTQLRRSLAEAGIHERY
jgi:RNA polymerase sigma factor (sigma-70 family)